jgi:hypothetical protein
MPSLLARLARRGDQLWKPSPGQLGVNSAISNDVMFRSRAGVAIAQQVREDIRSKQHILREYYAKYGFGKRVLYGRADTWRCSTCIQE